uniref:Nascent polypeptide-associated complex subunit alpha-like UBA domain-containing protein n=1 Tax=Panagrolaimus sp. JU765 TaxID=591449 RepID=A0AC34RM53_9BILA
MGFIKHKSIRGKQTNKTWIMANHENEDDVENVEEKKNKQWGAQEVNKASSKMTDDTQDERDDMKDVNLAGIGIKAETVAIKVKSSDVQFIVDHLYHKKATAESLLIANGGDIKKAVFADLGLDSLPSITDLAAAR